LKSSHINYPSNFQKNITDLHILRASLGYSKILITQPLCSPQRDEPIELLLKTRIMETEIIQRAQVDLNMINNEEFFDHNNKFSVQGRIPHDDIHELVKYGEHPIYESLKIDKSKALIEKSLFEKIDYQTKLNC
ncbi:6593_t:CDS:2, partial [Rhizophagus irregularis]